MFCDFRDAAVLWFRLHHACTIIDKIFFKKRIKSLKKRDAKGRLY
jgi:hypothetical protein